MNTNQNEVHRYITPQTSDRRKIIRSLMIFLWQLFLLITSFLKNFYKLLLPSSPKDITGQLALVTGGANGLGRNLCISLAKKGCNIAIVDIDIENAEKTCKEIQNLGVKVKSFKVDVSKIDEVKKLKDNVERDLGTVDILINNAGIIFCKGITEESSVNLQKMIDVNLMGSMWTIQTFLDGMIQRKRGHIVAMSSAAALFGTSHSLCYTASKSGLRGLMEGLSIHLHLLELSDFIKTTCILPMFIDTNLDVRNAVLEASKYTILEKPDDAAQYFVQEILKNEDIITLPSIAYYISYIL